MYVCSYQYNYWLLGYLATFSPFSLPLGVHGQVYPLSFLCLSVRNCEVSSTVLCIMCVHVHECVCVCVCVCVSECVWWWRNANIKHSQSPYRFSSDTHNLKEVRGIWGGGDLFAQKASNCHPHNYY
jgi:hypothetical protein